LLSRCHECPSSEAPPDRPRSCRGPAESRRGRDAAEARVHASVGPRRGTRNPRGRSVTDVGGVGQTVRVPGFAVVDLETTGFSPRLGDRVAEVAVVLVDDAGRVEDEWCTLVNPERDLGPQHVHGIAAADVALAPTFDLVAPALLHLLAGRVLVAHNAAVDTRF